MNARAAPQLREASRHATAPSGQLWYHLEELEREATLYNSHGVVESIDGFAYIVQANITQRPKNNFPEHHGARHAVEIKALLFLLVGQGHEHANLVLILPVLVFCAKQ